MTGPDHYREAERLIEQTHVVQSDNGPGCGSEELLAEAQVHATLALAAATAMAACNEAGMHETDFNAWDAVAGVPL